MLILFFVGQGYPMKIFISQTNAFVGQGYPWKYLYHKLMHYLYTIYYWCLCWAITIVIFIYYISLNAIYCTSACYRTFVLYIIWLLLKHEVSELDNWHRLFVTLVCLAKSWIQREIAVVKDKVIIGHSQHLALQFKVSCTVCY